MSRILIVDDEPSILSVLSTLLKAQGHDVNPVLGGDKALEVLNVTESAQWHSLLEKYEGQGVSFSHLLNVAGIIRPGFSFENTARDTGIQLSVNVMGTVNGCLAQ